MQRNTGSQIPRHTGQILFTASEIGEYEYCPLAWWYARYEPHVDVDTEELFAEMVEMEQAYGAQAPTLPEYQFIEQLLIQRGAFEEGRQQHGEHALLVAESSDLEEMTEERLGETGITERLPQLRTIMLVLAALAIVCIVIALVFASH